MIRKPHTRDLPPLGMGRDEEPAGAPPRLLGLFERTPHGLRARSCRLVAREEASDAEILFEYQALPARRRSGMDRG